MASSQTFLDAVNAVLSRNGVLQGATGALTSFTDSARQRQIDVAIQCWNEGIQHLLNMGLMPGETASATMILSATGQREYDKPSDYIRPAGTRPETRIWRAATQSYFLQEYPGGYEQMIVDQITATGFTGRPVRWTINPTTDKFRIDTDSTVTDTYNLLYEKRIRFTSTSTATSNTFPFDDLVVDALVPVVAEFHGSVIKGEPMDAATFKLNLSRAASMVAQIQPSKRYGIRYGRG